MAIAFVRQYLHETVIVKSIAIPTTGHFLAEESPDELPAALTAFLAPTLATA